MKISNRALGYISMLAIITLFAYIGYSMYTAQQSVSHVATVDFNELGSLQPEDPVVIRGFRVGTIGTVTWLGDRARITIKFDTPVVLREGTEFNNVNFALMGQRRLEITPSKTGKVMPADHVFTGHFEPGIAEALRFIENVNQQVSVIRDVIHVLTEGDSTHQSAPEVFEQTFSAIEAFLDSADTEAARMTPQITQLFNQLNQTSKSIGEATIKADSTIKIATSAVNEKLDSIQSTIRSISETAEKTNKAITDIENSTLSAEVLKTTQTVEKINSIIDKFNQVIKAINTKGIKVYDKDGNPVKLIKWKNMNIVGQTARSKAKDRADSAAAQTKPEVPAAQPKVEAPAAQKTEVPAAQPKAEAPKTDTSAAAPKAKQ